MHEGVGIKNPLFFIGIIEDNVDPRREGRCKVRAFGVHGTNQDIPTEDLPWAIVVQGDYNPNNVPRLNSWIFGVFLDGRDAQQPMILGLIPTQHLEPLNPEERGFGRIPPEDGQVLAQGSRPEDIGQPRNSRLARGEYVEETYVLAQEMNRRRENRVGGSEDESWEEPGSAYNAQYPHNRVIETAAHTIELDDTPGAERIMVYHKSGSFVQIDTRGTTTHKSVSDKYEINDRRQHVYVGSGSYVTIQGNSHVYVKGNKTEEIMGDYQQIIHGNAIYSVGGQMTMQGSEQMQLRAGDLKMEANVGTMVIRAAKEAQILAGQGAFIKTPKLWAEVTDAHIKTENLNMESTGAMNILGEELYITGTSDANLYGTAKLQVGTGGLLSIYGGTKVAIDEYVSMANGEAEDASAADPAATTAEGGLVEGEVVAPEPPAKNTSVEPADPPAAVGSSGYSSRDHSGVDGGSTDSVNTTPVDGGFGEIGPISAPGQWAEDDAFLAEVRRVASRFGFNPNSLLGLMASESGLSAQARNPNGGATGLIQFMPATARGLGTTTDALIRMTRAEQMIWVERFFEPYAGNLRGASAGKLYAYVFLPARANRTILTSRGENFYEYNRGLDMNNDGHITIADLDARIARKAAEYGIDLNASDIDVGSTNDQTTPSQTTPAGPGGNGGV